MKVSWRKLLDELYILNDKIKMYNITVDAWHLAEGRFNWASANISLQEMFIGSPSRDEYVNTQDAGCRQHWIN